MLKSNELRLGNWVEDIVSYRFVKIDGIESNHDVIWVDYKDGSAQYDLNLLNLKPIELTEEILLSIKGINKKIVDNKGLELTIYTINDIELLFTFGILRNIKFMNNKVIIYTAFRDFKLHDLQNLYFILNGKELEINL